MQALNKKIISVLFCFLTIFTGSSALAQGNGSTNTGGAAANAAVCNGDMEMLMNLDLNTLFPVTIMGMQMTAAGNTNSPLMDMMGPICVCPTYLFGMPFYGITASYWEPVFLSEIERRPGCLSSLGGVSILSSYSALHSELNSQDTNGVSVNRMQVHWYEYPLMYIVDYFETMVCRSKGGVALAYVTEIDPYWNNDVLSALFTPEGEIFGNVLAEFACAVDSVTASLGYPLDPLFWCAGTWGPVYPFSGNSSHVGDQFSVNNLIQAKFLARSHRLGVQMQTIGPSAVCYSHSNPIWIKSQYRYNQVGPFPRKGRAVQTGDFGRFFTQPFVTNVPTQEHTVNIIWQGKQCCIRF